MEIDLIETRKHVELYFKERLPQYTVLEVRRKSRHPDDSHLFMVSAKKADGTYAVWSSWNQELRTLNHGHYGLTSLEACESVFEQFYYKG